MIYSCDDTNYSSNNSNKNGDYDAIGVQRIISERGCSECKELNNDCRTQTTYFCVSCLTSTQPNSQLTCHKNDSVSCIQKSISIQQSVCHMINNSRLEANHIDSKYYRICHESKDIFYLDQLLISYIEDERAFYKLSQIKSYMFFQNDINSNMRNILVEYISQVVYSWKYSERTYYTSIYIVDCFLSKNAVTRDSLQLIGIASLMISAKYHESNSYPISAYIYVSDGACTKDDILKYESLIFESIDFVINVPTTLTFFEVYLTYAQLTNQEMNFGKQLLLNTSLNYAFLSFCPSVIAEAVLYKTLLQFERIESIFYDCILDERRENIRSCVNLLS